MSTDLKAWAIDTAERAGSAAGLAAVSVVTAELTGKPVWWALCALPLLEVLRGWLARYNGEPASASFKRSGRDAG